jgi:hypothetical protein
LIVLDGAALLKEPRLFIGATNPAVAPS